MAEYTVKPLRRDTWDAFARLVEWHNGVWGGCWCLSFHPKFPERGQSVEGNRALKQRLVYEGQAHASVVFDGDRAVDFAVSTVSSSVAPRAAHRIRAVKRPSGNEVLRRSEQLLVKSRVWI